MTREDLMEHLYRDGRTLEEIGRLYCLSRERIRQILSKRGVPGGIGQQVRTQASVDKRWRKNQERKDARSMKFYGCSYQTILDINGGRNISDSGSPAHYYINQRKSAHTRGIEWKMSLAEWWGIWTASGKWSLRGRGKDRYCMSRKGDVGGYEKDNVEIITNSRNSADSYIAKPAAKRQRPANHKTLTDRQRQVLILSSRGLDATAIAGELGITPQTVKIHLCCIKQKIGYYEKTYGKAAAEQMAVAA